MKTSLETRSLAGGIDIGSSAQKRTVVCPVTAVGCEELGRTWPVVSELSQKIEQELRK